MNFTEGEYIYLDKPYGMSSFGALARVRYLISQRLGVKRLKTGHAGTLDPLATGVLILCTGRKTKEIERLQLTTKEYVATMQLGATTPSFDMEHTVDATYPTAHITRAKVEAALARFVGEISQVPPEYWLQYPPKSDRLVSRLASRTSALLKNRSNSFLFCLYASGNAAVKRQSPAAITLNFITDYSLNIPFISVRVSLTSISPPSCPVIPLDTYAE